MRVYVNLIRNNVYVYELLKQQNKVAHTYI